MLADKTFSQWCPYSMVPVIYITQCVYSHHNFGERTLTINWNDNTAFAISSEGSWLHPEKLQSSFCRQ